MIFDINGALSIGPHAVVSCMYEYFATALHFACEYLIK